MRLFLGVEIPDSIKTGLSALQKPFSRLDYVRLTKRENFHWTIKFLGEVDDAKAILERLSFLSQCDTFKIRIAGLGAFPSVTQPRVIWIGVTQGQELMANLMERVEKALLPLGFKEEKERTPHLTLAKTGGSNKPELTKIINENRDTDIGEMDISSLILYKSEVGPAGRLYTELKKFELRKNGR